MISGERAKARRGEALNEASMARFREWVNAKRAPTFASYRQRLNFGLSNGQREQITQRAMLGAMEAVLKEAIAVLEGLPFDHSVRRGGQGPLRSDASGAKGASTASSRSCSTASSTITAPPARSPISPRSTSRRRIISTSRCSTSRRRGGVLARRQSDPARQAARRSAGDAQSLIAAENAPVVEDRGVHETAVAGVDVRIGRRIAVVVGIGRGGEDAPGSSRCEAGVAARASNRARRSRRTAPKAGGRASCRSSAAARPRAAKRRGSRQFSVRNSAVEKSKARHRRSEISIA